MKVRMLKDQLGSNDGINAIEFQKGRVYTCPGEISSFLVNTWLKRNVCEVVRVLEPSETKIEQPSEKKKRTYKKKK